LTEDETYLGVDELSLSVDELVRVSTVAVLWPIVSVMVREKDDERRETRKERG
jgi:hypothetical protein